MSAPSAFSIVLDRHVYAAGDQVMGYVVLHTVDALSVRGIRIQCKGTIKTHFEVTDSSSHAHHHHSGDDNDGTHHHSHNHQTRRTVSSTKSVTDTETTVWGSREKGFLVAGSDLAPGQYTFPFAFQLPPDAPTSFESESGHIRYKLRAYLDRPWKSDFVTHVRFHVNARVDPTVAAGYDAMRSVEAQKTVCCWIWAQGTLHSRLACDRTVLDPATFPAGTSLAARLHIDNWSSRKCKNMTVSLVRRDTFLAESHTHVHTVVVAKSVIPAAAPAKTTGHVFDVHLGVLPTLAPSILNADIVRVEYALELHASVSWACPLKASLPVLVCPSPAFVQIPASMLAPGTFPPGFIPPPPLNGGAGKGPAATHPSSYHTFDPTTGMPPLPPGASGAAAPYPPLLPNTSVLAGPAPWDASGASSSSNRAGPSSEPNLAWDAPPPAYDDPAAPSAPPPPSKGRP
ncbi:hypothetical protein H9P43_004327 [Blastocladiella emersonii ATCC 22665]|nr:hypothetical protein H9P43_004327 [Blastocladiella emersonii ATCC 22665]